MRRGSSNIRIIGEFLQLAFPQAHTRTISAAAICGNEQMLRERITNAAHVLPPTAHGLHGEGRRIIVDPDIHPARVGCKIINSAGRGAAGEVGKDVVSRTWRRVKGDWDAWNARSLTDEPIIRLILDGTVVRVRLDKTSTSISLLVALGVRADGQRVLLAVKNMGGESEAAWRALLDDLVRRGLRAPELVIVDGEPGLEKALATLWWNVPVGAARCTSAAICWPMRRSGCTKKYRTTART